LDDYIRQFFKTDYPRLLLKNNNGNKFQADILIKLRNKFMLTKDDILQFRIFEGITLEELDAVISMSDETSYNAGEIILEESSFGSDSDFYVILQGNVKVELEASQVQTVGMANKRLAVLKNGDVFGEMGLLRSRRRSAQVSAYSDITALKVNQQKLFDLFVYNPRLGYLIMRNLAAILSDRIMEMNFMWRDDI
jgi:CRP/FNR family cyclic AMP-dependent transcriptional regulator